MIADLRFSTAENVECIILSRSQSKENYRGK